MQDTPTSICLQFESLSFGVPRIYANRYTQTYLYCVENYIAFLILSNHSLKVSGVLSELSKYS